MDEAGLKMLPVDHVLDGGYIGSYRATMFADQLRHAGITNVLKLYEDIPYFPADFCTLENALEDGEFIPTSTLKRGVQFILDHVDVGEPVLVVCGAGISRSSTFVLAYLLERSYNLHNAFHLLRENHPAAMPHPQMWLSLITHYQLKDRPEEALSWYREEMKPE
jgi:protein-tyrosine phosphatase